MKLSKRSLKTGKVVKIDSYDAFDEISMDNYGMLQDWDINTFDDFVKFFKEKLGDEIQTGEYVYFLEEKKEVKGVKEKLTEEQFMMKRQGKAMEEYLDRAISTARRVVLELEGYKSKVVDQNYIKYSGKEKIVQWVMNMLQQINWHFDDGADVATKYAVAKLAKEFAEKQA